LTERPARFLDAPHVDNAPPNAVGGNTRLAILCDYLEEVWPSMDLCGEMLARELQLRPRDFSCQRLLPPFRRRLGRLTPLPFPGARFNADRLLNRLFDYPRFLREHLQAFDYFHVVDQSYAHLVHSLPAERTGVFCHDLDVFRCLFHPEQEPRPRWFRAMMRRCMRGFSKAAVVFHSTLRTRELILQHGLVSEDRLVHAPYGIAPEFCPQESGTIEDAQLLADLARGPYLLHVGNCIPRKRIDVLLDVFASVRSQIPDVRLVKVGGSWTPEQEAQIDRLEIGASLVHKTDLSRADLAAIYRGASVVLLPSEAEGFGLPVIEALACGSVVVASDLATVREVGGDAVVYCPVADVPAWVDSVLRLLRDPATAPARGARLQRAGRYTWAAHAQTIEEAYARLRDGNPK